MFSNNEILNQIQSFTLTDQLLLLKELQKIIEHRLQLEGHDLVLTGAAESSLNPESRRQKIGEILSKLAALNPFAEISDPVEWQRELRQDIPLPGR